MLPILASADVSLLFSPRFALREKAIFREWNLRFFAMLIYIVILAISAYLVYNFLLKPENEKSEEINIGEETSPKNYEKVVLKTNVNYDGANIMTAKGPGNICVAIFKNPVDHKTHFYRTRLKGKLIHCV